MLKMLYTNLQDWNNNAKEADGTTKDLDDEDLDEQGGVLCISQGSSWSHNTHTDPTEQVRQAHRQAGAKHSIPCMNGKLLWIYKV